MSEIRIVATLIAKPEHTATIHRAVERVVEPSRQEVGNIQYDLHEEIGHKGTYVFFEVWASQEAVDHHNNTVHFQNFVKEIEGKLEMLDIKVLHQIA